MITFERNKKELIIRLPSSSIIDAQEIMDFLKYKNIVKKSKATKSDLIELNRIAKEGRWERTRAKLNL